MKNLATLAAAPGPPGFAEFRRMALTQASPHTALRHETITQPGPPPDCVWIVQHGWALARGDRAAGRSPILRIYLPGDIIGLSDLGLTQQLAEIQMLTEGLLHAVPRRTIAALARQHPRFWPMLIALCNAEAMQLQTRALLMDRAGAEDRLIHLFLDLRARLAVEGVGDGSRFPLPLNQQEIGEATGMTGIYVNRLLGRMVRDGRLEIQRPYMRLLDRAWMESRLDGLGLTAGLDPFWADHS